MKRLALALFMAIAMGHGTSTFAQDSLVGTYTGSFTAPGRMGDTQVGVQLIIASVENGVVKGTANLALGSCAGVYPMQGRYDGNRLGMKATAKGGSGGDCSFGLTVAREGNKLVGTTGSGQPIQLSK